MIKRNDQEPIFKPILIKHFVICLKINLGILKAHPYYMNFIKLFICFDLFQKP
jgi:hypothetical protein